MQNMLYLGIDESNNGRTPEIFVAVASRRPTDIQITELTKQRKPNEISKVLGKNRQFRHILIPKEDRKVLGPHNTRLMVFAEFINQFDGLEKVIIDGPVRKADLKKLNGILHHHPAIFSEKQADKHYKIVNIADNIASLLHKKYVQKHDSEAMRKLLKYRLTPKIEEYVNLLLP